MNTCELIIKKRGGGELTQEEIEYLIGGYVAGSIPDYQISSLLMAVYFRGMTERETFHLTRAMIASGETLDLSKIDGVKVDKHSTGGVGDKVTLIVAPTVSSCGLPVGKMSGRGLGFSGGTLDKLESIPGYRVDLSREEFIAQLITHGIVVTGQSADLAPADGKLYALRDVTGTVQSLPLIAASVMSKKIAGGAHAIVLDVKTGVGAFMETLEDARKLARLMVSIGRISGRKVVALISDMNQPLGSAVGNALELKEAIQALQGNGPLDLVEHCVEIASHMLVLGKKALDLDQARSMARNAIVGGAAWNKFRELVQAQNGDVRYVDDPALFPVANFVEPVTAPVKGTLKSLNAREVGETSVELGAGRARKGDPIDHAVGILVHHKVGDWVEEGEPIFTIHANDAQKLENARLRLLQACEWSDQVCPPLPLFYGVIE